MQLGFNFLLFFKTFFQENLKQVMTLRFFLIVKSLTISKQKNNLFIVLYSAIKCYQVLCVKGKLKKKIYLL